jgi:hypothetical protein
MAPLKGAAILAFAQILCGGITVHAADMGSAAARDKPANAEEADELDTENIFGFTEGTDVGEKGEREISVDMFGGFGRQHAGRGPSRYFSGEAEAEFEYGLTDSLSLGLGASLVYHDIRNIADLDDLVGGEFNGLSAELKYRILNRETVPIGLAVSLEPEWSRFEDDSGERADGFELNTKLMIDRELVPDKLFGAMNVIYTPEWSHGEDGTEKESSLEVSGALSVQVTPGIFVGGELRYLTSYEGLAFDHLEGSAFYGGPSFYAQLSKSTYFKVAYSYQFAGSSPDSGNNLDLIGHDRHQLKVGVGVEF